MLLAWPARQRLVLSCHAKQGLFLHPFSRLRRAFLVFGSGRGVIQGSTQLLKRARVSGSPQAARPQYSCGTRPRPLIYARNTLAPRDTYTQHMMGRRGPLGKLPTEAPAGQLKFGSGGAAAADLKPVGPQGTFIAVLLL